MHETQRAHVEHCYKKKPQTERSLFTNSSSTMEGHINKDMQTNMLLMACTKYYFIDMAFHRARRIRKQASFRLWLFFVTVLHMRAPGFVHVYQTERSLFKNSSSSMEGHINKVIFSTCTLTRDNALTCYEWQLQLMKQRCCFKIVGTIALFCIKFMGTKRCLPHFKG